MKAKILDVSKALTTIRFTSGDQELTRNFVNNDFEMLSEIIESTQKYFLMRQYRGADFNQRLVQVGPEMESERKALIEEVKNDLAT